MSDSLVKLLNGLGYQPVFLPRTGLTPPDLYNFANHRLVRRGPLLDYLPRGTTFAPESGQAADIEHKQTSGKGGEASLSFLKNALRCIGIDGAPKLDLSFASDSKLAFSFTGVTFVSIPPAQIDHALAPLALGAVPEEFVTGGELHIAYEYLFACQLLMSRVDQRHFGGDVSASVGQYLDVGVKGKVEVQSATTISFSGNAGTPAAFAFKVGQLRKSFDGAKWMFYPEESMASVPSPGLEAATGAERRPMLLSRGVVLTVDDQGGSPSPT